SAAFGFSPLGPRRITPAGIFNWSSMSWRSCSAVKVTGPGGSGWAGRRVTAPGPRPGPASEAARTSTPVPTTSLEGGAGIGEFLMRGRPRRGRRGRTRPLVGAGGGGTLVVGGRHDLDVLAGRFRDLEVLGLCTRRDIERHVDRVKDLLPLTPPR